MSDREREAGGGSDQDQDGPKALREALERQKAENAELRGKLRQSAFREVGIDTTTGLGKTMAEFYDGDADPDAIRQFATERFEWKPPEPKPGDEPPETPGKGELRKEVTEQVVEAGERIDKTVEKATSTDGVDDLDAKIAEAEANKDWQTAMKLKALKTRQIAVKKGLV